jgi:hypothetical protein
VVKITWKGDIWLIPPPPLLFLSLGLSAQLRVACRAAPARPSLFSDGDAGRRRGGCVVRAVQSSTSFRLRSRLVLPLWSFGVLPLLSLLLAPASSAGTRWIRFLLWRPWWMKGGIESGRGSSLNKPASMFRVDLLKSVALASSSRHQGDGGGRGWTAAAGRSTRWGRSSASIFWSSSSAAPH